MTDPVRVGVAGDWHGNTRWATSTAFKVAHALDDLYGEERRLLLHCGDLGIAPGAVGSHYTIALCSALVACQMRLWFVDGNHEDHPQLPSWELGKYEKVPLEWLPRGHRWLWHGRSWLALGGAVSVDKAVRTPYVDWWPEEEITYRQAADVTEAGHADVMVCHDAPLGVPLKLMAPPSFWEPADLRRSDNHRRLLREVVEVVQPQYLLHGHYHQGGPHWREVEMSYGTLRVASLNMDARSGNWGILNVKTMEWEPSE
jgi:Calcineurin-like phosphoesterase